MVSKSEAHEALQNLMAELPAEFYSEPDGRARDEFKVIKRRNVRSVHNALWQLQQYFGE